MKLNRSNTKDKINEKDIKTTNLIILCVQKLEGKLNMISGEMDDRKHIQVELLELKTTMCEIKKKKTDKIGKILDNPEEKIEKKKKKD